MYSQSDTRNLWQLKHNTIKKEESIKKFLLYLSSLNFNDW